MLAFLGLPDSLQKLTMRRGPCPGKRPVHTEADRAIVAVCTGQVTLTACKEKVRRSLAVSAIICYVQYTVNSPKP